MNSFWWILPAGTCQTTILKQFYWMIFHQGPLFILILPSDLLYLWTPFQPLLALSWVLFCLLSLKTSHWNTLEDKNIKAWIVYTLKAGEGHLCLAQSCSFSLFWNIESRLWIQCVLSGSVLALKHDTNNIQEEHLVRFVPVLFPVCIQIDLGLSCFKNFTSKHRGKWNHGSH